MSSPAIVVENLVKSYGKLRAVDGVSFSVDPGEVFALLGPNGAGKTTTVEILEGFKRPDGGRATVLGVDPATGKREIAKHIGVMPQEAGLYAGIRAHEAVSLFASFYDDPEKPDELLERVGLERARTTPWRRMSGGEKQRLSLALALVGRPEVAFLDEPTAGVDVHGRARVWDLVEDLRQRGAVVVLTTHMLEEAERVANRVGIIHRGRLLALGPPSQLSPASDEIHLRVDGTIDLPGAEQTGPGAYRLRGTTPTPEYVARLTATLAEQNVLVRELRVGRRSLEDVFLELTKDDA